MEEVQEVQEKEADGSGDEKWCLMVQIPDQLVPHTHFCPGPGEPPPVNVLPVPLDGST